MVRKVDRINRPDLDAKPLQREYRSTVSDVPVNDAGLDRQNVQEEELLVIVLVLVLAPEVKGRLAPREDLTHRSHCSHKARLAVVPRPQEKADPIV